jgi:LysR family transcriptional regulator, regulator for metE and metH
VARHLNAATLKALSLGRSGFRRTWHAATLRSRRPPAYLDAFVDLLARPGVLA